jgi:hypothetical protein
VNLTIIGAGFALKGLEVEMSLREVKTLEFCGASILAMLGNYGNTDGARYLMMRRDNNLTPKDLVEGGNHTFIEGSPTLEKDLFTNAFAADDSIQVIINRGIGKT